MPRLPARPSGPASKEAALRSNSPGREWLGTSLGLMAGWLTSGLFHLAVLILLARLVLPLSDSLPPPLLATQALEPPDEIALLDDPLEELTADDALDPSELAPIDKLAAELEVSSFDETPAPSLTVELFDLGHEAIPTTDLLNEVGSASGRGLEGRGAAARQRLVEQRGGSVASEAAVARGLEWLARHQMKDGGWNFDHRHGDCQSRCSQPGNMHAARHGATALVLLPFLGAGQTHKEGKYRRVVQQGLDFLSAHVRRQRNHGSWLEPGGSMYSHGLATIALCEAYAMTDDRRLHQPAQIGLNFIVAAQDPAGGGWRYRPGEPGDTSVVGWQLMALKSGHMAYLHVPANVVAGVDSFLNTVQTGDGAGFGYVAPPANVTNAQGTTAVGLLCRMYLGWKREHPSISRGVEHLSGWGPSQTNFYYNYYATQVMHHFGGEAGEAWNAVMRDQLVDAQVLEGHERGSWFAQGGDHGETAGGRLYFTALGVMTLEVYYRHLPLYQEQSLNAEFP